MNKDNFFETIVGAVVIIFCGFFIYFIGHFYKPTISNYTTLIAKFSNADGINIGTDIKISGIKVGKVSSITLDSENFDAIVKLDIDSRFTIPNDSSALIRTNGLVGNRYIEISIGGSDDMMQRNNVFSSTQSSVLIEDILGKFLLNFGKDK